MKTTLATLLLSFSLSSSAYVLDRAALKTEELPFISHHTPVAFGSYLTQEVPYTAIKALYEELVKDIGPLKNRGEAHITIVTPVEFDKVLSAFLTIQDINSIAIKKNIQSARFIPICVGSGAAMINGKEEKTYYIVVNSPQMISIRQTIQKAFIKKGGKAQEFTPEKFFPHITLGFTERDLHESDGVIKNSNSCLRDGGIELR